MRRIASTAKPATSRIRRRISPGSRPKAAAVRIIRICEARLKIILVPVATALLLAGCANMPALKHSASTESGREANAFSTYLSARFAAGEHQMPEAARYYAQSLKNDPGNAAVLSQAFFFVSTSGDMDSAGKYATEMVGKVPDERSARP